mmetsp:Transcript_206/g.211  ORF Transcript_206/g.211 Transcript_206/m.211 type:complete len:307 (+) Transcript_206:1049-1969(+)
MLVSNLDLLNLVAPFALAMLAELGGKDCEANLSLLDVCSSDFDEDVAGVESDLGRLRVNDGRQRQHLSVLVVEHRVLLEGLKNWQELLHLDVVLENFEKRVAVHRFVLLERLEHDIAGWVRLVSDWAANFVQIVRAHGCECPSAANILMQLILQVDEGVVGGDVEADIPKHASHHAWADSLRLRLDDDFLKTIGLILDGVSGGDLGSEIGAEGSSNALDAEEVIPVGGDLDLVDILLGDVEGVAVAIDAVHLHLFGRAMLQLHTEVEAQVLKLVLSEASADFLEQLFSQYVHVGHLYSGGMSLTLT